MWAIILVFKIFSSSLYVALFIRKDCVFPAHLNQAWPLDFLWTKKCKKRCIPPHPHPQAETLGVKTLFTINCFPQPWRLVISQTEAAPSFFFWCKVKGAGPHWLIKKKKCEPVTNLSLQATEMLRSFVITALPNLSESRKSLVCLKQRQH